MALNKNEAPLFDASRATDLPYCLGYVQARIASYNDGKNDTRAHIQLHQFDHGEKGTLFGIVDMMFCIGDFCERKVASKAWARLKANPPPSWGGVPFWVENTAHSNQMDFCSIGDFLDKVLPHVGGSVAEIIKQARGVTATLVATGSRMAIALTEANAESSKTMGPQISALTSCVRSGAEEKAGTLGVVPDNLRALTGVVHRELRSAGFCNPDHLNEPRIYFGLPSFDSDLETNIRVFGSGEPEPYVAGETLPIVKAGATEDGKGQRAKDHGKLFSGFKTLDWVKCLQPKAIESRLKVWLQTKGLRRTGVAKLKLSTDVELFRVYSQEEYNEIVQKAA